MPLADYHKLIRAAMADVVKGLDLGPPVVELDDLEADVGLVTAFPCVALACVGPEQDRPEFATNVSDGTGYPVAIAHLGLGQGNGAKSPESPDMTYVRRTIKAAFHMKRLSGVDQVGYCEVSGDPLILDREGPCFQRLSSYLIVTAVGRFPRS
jgi:hypothetical protein